MRSVNQDNNFQEDYSRFQTLKNEFSVETENAESSVEDDSQQEITEPFDPKSIDINSKTLTLDNLIKRLRENEIDLNPEFQRSGNLWTHEQQSQLIESLLIRIPLPAFYFDGTNDERWLVVDGLQRLSAIKNFVVKNELKLTGLEFLEKKIGGLTFSQLPRPYQRQIEETNIVAYIINPGTPEDVKFNIFKRINTGGKQLELQEIRHALNQGLPARFISRLAACKEFIRATQNAVPVERMLDREFVTRFVAFYLFSPDDYRTDLDTFLSRVMKYLRKLSPYDLFKIEYDFKAAMNLARFIFTRWTFRKVFYRQEKRYPINKALFEVWSVCLARLTSEERKKLMNEREFVFESFMKLMRDDSRFVASISASTGDRTKVKYRFTKIKELINRELAI